MTITKRQHYIPRFYLRRFTNSDGQLHAYRRDEGRSFITTPENVCAENYLYEVDLSKVKNSEAAHSHLDNCIENQLSGAEGRLAPLYEQLIQCCESKSFKSKEYLDGRLAVCLLAASIVVRHPAMLGEDRGYARELVKDVEANGGITEQEQAMLDQFGLGDNLEPIADITIMQTLLFSTYSNAPIQGIYQALADKRMTIVEAPISMRFITTSMPVYFLEVEEEPFCFNQAFIPLSYKYAAVFSDGETMPLFRKATIEEVIRFNVALLMSNDIWDVAVANSSGSINVALREMNILR
ncbi:MAG: DUF4238 domain-containing protein [Eggerthellaceae bacterium]|jgi:hypothetical protein